MANSHPFFSGVTVDGAAAWTAQYLIDQEPHFATDAGKPLYSAEIGWPTDAIAGGSFLPSRFCSLYSHASQGRSP